MKIIIHIGPHKTGTTAIQKCLLESSEFLSSKGIFYPDMDIIQYGHHSLAIKVRNRLYSDADLYIKSMIRNSESMNSNTILLSSEIFSTLRGNNLKKLHELIKHLNVEIVYNQRNPIRQIYSWWQEEVKHGLREQFPLYLVERILQERRSHLIRPDTILKRWSNLFGRENIKCLKYHEGADAAPDIFTHILNCEVPHESPSSTDINKSFKPAEVELIRLFNHRGVAGVNLMLHPDFQHLRHKVVALAGRFLRKIDVRSNEQIKTSIERVNAAWADRFLNLEGGEPPIDDEIVRVWSLDPAFWLFNQPLSQQIMAFLESA